MSAAVAADGHAVRT